MELCANWNEFQCEWMKKKRIMAFWNEWQRPIASRYYRMDSSLHAKRTIPFIVAPQRFATIINEIVFKYTYIGCGTLDSNISIDFMFMLDFLLPFNARSPLTSWNSRFDQTKSFMQIKWIFIVLTIIFHRQRMKMFKDVINRENDLTYNEQPSDSHES